MGSDEERSKKEKREARSPEDAAAREVRKAAKRAKKEGGGGGGEGVSGGADGAVARVRVSPVPPSSDAAAIAAFLGVDAAKVVVLSNEATAIMPDADAAANAASTLDETKFKGRFVRVIRDDFKPDAVAVAADAHDAGEDEVRERAERARQPPSRRDDAGEARGDVVEVDCAGQTGRIIGKGGSKIREIEELTGCVLRVRQEEGVCEVSGRDVNAAVQEIKNIVQEGRERDGGGGAVGGAFAGGSREPASAPPRADAAAASRPFGVPPPGSASRHDTGANDWTCACGSVNFARRTACFGCHAPRRANGADASRLAEPPGGRVPAGSKPAAAAARAPAQGHDDDGYEVFVKYLPHETSEAEVGAFFAENFGPLKGDVRLIRDRNGRCKGAGFVTFASEASRAECLRRDGARFGGRHISVSVAKTGTFGVRATEQKVGTHTPAMLRETLDALVLADPRGVYVDGTFGRGGHSRGILGALAPEGRLHAFDMDPEAIAEGKKLEAQDARFTIHHAPFGCMDKVLAPLGVRPAGVFLDLGISSPQFDDQGRGFRPEQDGPLDLRFDLTKGVPASKFLQTVDRDELTRIVGEYGETADPSAARRVADAVVVARESGELPSTTRAFAALVAAAKGMEYQAMHPAKLTFQALRIHLNQEFDEMRRGMRAAMETMRDGGALGVLTWKHSECAILMDFYRHFEKARPDAPLTRWFEAHHPSAFADALAASAGNGAWAVEADDALRPSEREMRENSRSRSAILHVLRRRDAAARTADLERAAYAKRGWSAPPRASDPPATTFEYEAAGARAAVPDDAETGQREASPPEKKAKKAKKAKKEKKEKKRGNKWAEA